MKKRKTRRGVSAGTIFTLALTAALLCASFFVFTRLMGDNAAIDLHPGVITDTLARMLPGSVRGSSHAAEPTAAPTATPVVPAVLATPAIRIENVQSEASEAPTLYMDLEFSLTAAGQISLGEELRLSGRQAADQYDYESAFAQIAGAAGSGDMSVVTLRSALSDGADGFGDYCAPVTLATALKSAGFNIINLGTDRILDRGLNGLAVTRAALGQRSLSSAGAYTSQQEEQSLSVVSINDIGVGLLSYTTGVSGVGMDKTTEEERAFAVRQYSDAAAKEDIAALRAEGADVVIVLIHWGKRGDTEPSRTTLEQADKLVAAGADVILGTGPTGVHRFEKRQTAEGKEAFIAYSLGNFLIDDSRETDDITGVILHLDMHWNSREEKLSFGESWYMPTWIMRWREGGASRYRIVPAGSSVTPEDMTDSIYVNMKKAYQRMTETLGTDAAQPRAE